MTSKVCSNCKKQKPVTQFTKHPTTKDRLQSWCRECKTEAQRQKRKGT